MRYQFQNKPYTYMRWEKFFIRFHYISCDSIKKVTLHSYLHYLNRFMIKQRENALSLKSFFFFLFDTTFRHKIFAQTLGSDYWELIH